MNVSGKTSNLTSSSAAFSIRAIVFLIVAFLFMKTGAAWAAATLNLVCFAAIVLRLDSMTRRAVAQRKSGRCHGQEEKATKVQVSEGVFLHSTLLGISTCPRCTTSRSLYNPPGRVHRPSAYTASVPDPELVKQATPACHLTYSCRNVCLVPMRLMPAGFVVRGYAGAGCQAQHQYL